MGQSMFMIQGRQRQQNERLYWLRLNTTDTILNSQATLSTLLPLHRYTLHLLNISLITEDIPRLLSCTHPSTEPIYLLQHLSLSHQPNQPGLLRAYPSYRLSSSTQLSYSSSAPPVSWAGTSARARSAIRFTNQNPVKA